MSVGNKISVVGPLIIVVATFTIFTDHVSAWYNTKTTPEKLHAAAKAIRFDSTDRWAPRFVDSSKKGQVRIFYKPLDLRVSCWRILAPLYDQCKNVCVFICRRQNSARR